MFKSMVNVLLVTTLMAASVSAAAEVSLRDLKGAWLGEMKIPDGPTLRVGMEVFKKADGQWGGNLASLDQGVRYMLVSDVSIENDVFRLQLDGAPVNITGKVSDMAEIDATFNQGPNTFPVVFKKVEALPEPSRKQAPTGKAPYHEEEVAYQNAADKTWLSGSLTYPKGKKKHPAIMLVAGSGPTHRDAYAAGHRMFKVLADHLTRQGYVVLRADKRGVYKSSGSFHSAKTEDFAADTQAAIAFLRTRKQVDANKIILIGHSEGSLVSVMAAQNESVQGIVSLAGPGMSVLDVLLEQDQTEPAAKGATKEETEVLLQFSKRFYAIILSTPEADARVAKVKSLYDGLQGKERDVVNKWVDRNNGTLSIDGARSEDFSHWLTLNPLDYWQQYRGKVLVLNGEKDSQVPAKSNIEGIVGAVKKSPGKVDSQLFPSLNHLFQSAKTGATDEYSEIDETINVGVLNVISTWLNKNF